MSAPLQDRLRAALADRYELHEELGAGGMATVYLADDLKHERRVAVKVLRPELAAVIGGERFISEIKTTAALQHPHILPLFDSGEADSFLYYVMPYVEGESLRKRIERERQLEVGEAVHITKAVASALQYAHERDIIHRDIKPENVLLHAGEPVVADFGIALAISAAGGGRMTETGLSLGTPHYMSPEQAAADRDLSARSDVYSLTCVLYEMLAGQPPHTGPTAQSILVRILTEDPRPVSDLRPTVPRHLRAILSKGLEKLPADRFKSADEFKAALDDQAFTYERVPRTGPVAGATVGTTAPALATGGGALSKLYAAAAVFFALTTAFFALRPGESPAVTADAPWVSFMALDSAEGVGWIEVGPDGTVAHIDRGRIYVRPPGALEPTPIDGVENADAMTLSPDGQWIAFSGQSGTEGYIRKVQISGGSIANVWSEQQRLSINPFWGDDGWIYFTSGGSVPDRISRVPDVGGAAEDLHDADGFFVFDPVPLPGGRALVFTSTNTSATGGRLVLMDLETLDTTGIVAEGFTARWSPTGHVVYGHGSGALWAVPFDLDAREVTGSPVPVLEGLATDLSFAIYDLNANGTLAYVAGAGSGTGNVGGLYYSLASEDGRREPLPIEPTDHPDARLSPDGRSLAYIRAGDVYIFDLDRGSNLPLTEGASGQHNPIWSPDGTEIAYRSNDDVMRRAVDRSSEAVPVTSTEDPDNPSEWLDDGTLILATEGTRNGDLVAVNVNNDEPAVPLLNANWQERGASVSPDGQWIAYGSARSGTAQLYVRTWPDLQSETLISGGDDPLWGAMYPQWSVDSRTLYYQKGFTIYAADLNTDDGIEVARTRQLPIEIPGGLLQDIHPDGRLLVTTTSEVAADDPDSETVPQRLIVSTNWFTELRARLGAGN